MLKPPCFYLFWSVELPLWGIWPLNALILPVLEIRSPYLGGIAECHDDGQEFLGGESTGRLRRRMLTWNFIGKFLPNLSEAALQCLSFCGCLFQYLIWQNVYCGQFLHALTLDCPHGMKFVCATLMSPALPWWLLNFRQKCDMFPSARES